MYFAGFLPCQTLSNFLYVHTTETEQRHELATGKN